LKLKRTNRGKSSAENTNNKKGTESSTMNLTTMNDQLCKSNSIRLKKIVQVIVVAQCLPNNELKYARSILSGLKWLTIIQLNMLIIKLTAKMSRASLREVARYVDSKSIIMVGSASVSSDTATVNIEIIKPTQRVQKKEHKMMTFLENQMRYIRID
jgi:hypothetical protein